MVGAGPDPRLEAALAVRGPPRNAGERFGVQTVRSLSSGPRASELRLRALRAAARVPNSGVGVLGMRFEFSQDRWGLRENMGEGLHKIRRVLLERRGLGC